MSDGGDSQPVALGASRVELRVSCWSLPERDGIGRPDPFVLLRQLCEGQWSEVGRSEELRSSQNPVFSRVFALDYFFEEMQSLRFEVFDADGAEADGEDPSEVAFLGAAECSLGQVGLAIPLG
uniref:C2 domain-containing protein n=1 Tax=Sphenodon punctatus TaxID=8508 RepID=A0A8D0LCF3_SPHPU